MKAKLAMNGIKSELIQTNDALAELSEVLIALNDALNIKKTEISKNKKDGENLLRSTNEKFEILKESSTGVLNNINGIINKLDKVLENDGNSYNNN